MPPVRSSSHWVCNMLSINLSNMYPCRLVLQLNSKLTDPPNHLPFLDMKEPLKENNSANVCACSQMCSILWTFWRLSMPSTTNLWFRTLIWSHSHHSHINRTYGHISWQNNFMCAGSLARHSARMPGKKLVAVLNQPWRTQLLCIQHMIVQHLLFKILEDLGRLFKIHEVFECDSFSQREVVWCTSTIAGITSSRRYTTWPERAEVRKDHFTKLQSIRRMFDRLFLPTARCSVPRVHVFAMSFRRGGGGRLMRCLLWQ